MAARAAYTASFLDAMDAAGVDVLLCPGGDPPLVVLYATAGRVYGGLDHVVFLVVNEWVFLIVNEWVVVLPL